MKRLLLFVLPFLLCGCSTGGNNESRSDSSEITLSSNSASEEIDMKLLIDEKELEVTWEDNDSVKALKELLPLTINMHEYGGFEQTGPIGHSIINNDQQMDVAPGDIVLYNGNAISIFYSVSAWSYTRLGHINLSSSELNDLLNKAAVTLLLK